MFGKMNLILLRLQLRQRRILRLQLRRRQKCRFRWQNSLPLQHRFTKSIFLTNHLKQRQKIFLISAPDILELRAAKKTVAALVAAQLVALAVVERLPHILLHEVLQKKRWRLQAIIQAELQALKTHRKSVILDHVLEPSC